MATTTIVNTFDKGMFLDSLKYTQPPGTYRYARNMVRGSREDIFPGLSTEESTDKLHTYGSKIVAAYYVESLDGTVYFTADGSIHLFDHTTRKTTFVAQDKEFGCDWGFQNCEWISATFKTDQPCSETKVYWSSGCEYYVVNIAEMLNPKRKASLISSIRDNNNGSCGLNCEYFRLMKCVCSPTLTALMSDRGGHKLVSGTYQFVVQLEDNGGNTTNWFSVSDPVSVASENNQPGEMSLGSIKVHLTNLDCRYDKVNIAVIKTVQGIQTAQIVASRHYSTDGVTFTYVGQDEGKFVTLQEIQAKRKMFIRGKDVAQKDSRLFLYNIRQEKNLNMQRRVLDEGTITFIEIETTAKMVERHGMRTWERGENYLFAVVYNYCDGTHSAAFLLKPNGGGGGGAGSSSSMTSPSGKAQKTKRPRGNTNDSGGCYGCCTGKCGGCGAGGCAPAGGDTNGETPPNEDERVENRTKENVDEWDTDIADTVEAAKCDDCHEPYCCETDDEGNVTIITDPNNTNCDGCEKDEEQYEKDLPNIQDIVGTHTDEMIFGNQDLDPEYNAYTFKSASSALIESIDNSEYRVIEKDKFEIVITAASGSSPEPKTEGSQQDTPELAKGGGGSGFGESETTIPSNEATTTPRVTEWSDEYTDGAGIYLLDEVPTIVGEVAPEVVLSEELYPDSKDCNGEFLYGGDANTPVKLFRTPTADKSPIVVPTSSGVPSPHSSADPLQSVKIRLLGLKAVNIPMPRPEDLPKPLCPNNPYTIVSIARDEINSTVQAKGIMFGTFTGTANGEPYTFMRHGANSRCNVDRWVGSGMHASRKGGGSGPGYGFYGLDTAVGRVGLSGSKFRQELKMSGQGYRYGLFAKGTEPKDALTGRRSDQRGARQYISLNIPQPNFSEVTMAAVGYCDPNAVTEVSGATNKVSTLSRESCVYIEAPLSKDTDSSFTSDTLNHNCPIPDAYGLYGAVVRDIPDQYGSVTGMTFIKTGLEGRGFDKAYQGVCGDTFIGPYSFIRQGFVSDKVGDKFNTPERQRTVCDSPNDLLLQQMGIDFYTTQIPLSGDKSDAKNWAGGHRDEEWDAAFGHPPEHDLYYPKTQRTLITTWIESRINPYYRATGYGPAEDGDIFWPKTKGFYLDSAATITKHPWEKSFINQFIHYRVDQPSVAQLARKAIVKALINLILPMLFMDKLGELTGVVDGVATLLTSPILIAYWYTMKKLLSRDDYLDKMLGLPVCRTDSAGGEQDDNFIEGKQDNYHAYNYDHSALNYANVFPAMPALYNTCSCDNCLNDETTNEIFYSNKQVQGSPIDFYKQFGALSYLEIPADSGKLNKLFNVNGNFYAHTSDFIIPIKFKDIGIPTTVGTARLGGNMLLADPTPILEGVVEGAFGITDPNSGINTIFGWLFVDRSARKLYLFDGKSAVPISSRGMDRFFKEHMDFCDLSSCHDEKNEAGTYYSLGYDPRFNRLLITKKEMDNKKSFTLSVDVSGENPEWISFHDYTPQAYVWDRSDLFSLTNGEVHLHHAKEGDYRTFYGKEYPSEIEFVALSDTESFVYENTFINTEAEKDQIRNLDDTFNRIAVYNTTQGTGTTDVVIFPDVRDGMADMSAPMVHDGKAHLFKIKRGFRFNNMFDNTKPACGKQAMTIRTKCIPIDEINEGRFDCSIHNKQNYSNNILSDDHLIYRMTYDNNNKTLLRLINVKTDVKKETR